MAENLTAKPLLEHLNLAMMTAVQIVGRIIPTMDWTNKRKTEVMQLVVMTLEPNPMVDMVSTLSREYFRIKQ